MFAFVENLSGLIRIGATCRSYGDPWEFICGYSSVDGKTAVLKGLRSDAKGFGKRHSDALNDALLAAGFQFASWDRHTSNGVVRHVTRDLRIRSTLTRRSQVA